MNVKDRIIIEDYRKARDSLEFKTYRRIAMKIKKELENNVLVLALEGRLDTVTAPELEREVSDLSGVTDLVFDMKNLEYISSAGLRVILKAQKTMNTQGSMKLKNVSESIMEVFEITGFSDILTIE